MKRSPRRGPVSLLLAVLLASGVYFTTWGISWWTADMGSVVFGRVGEETTTYHPDAPRLGPEPPVEYVRELSAIAVASGLVLLIIGGAGVFAVLRRR